MTETTTTEDIAQDVIAVYEILTGERGDYLWLSDLRARLGDRYDRTDLDATLRTMNRSHAASVIPAQTGRLLTPARAVAAVRIGGQDAHLISID